MAKKDKTRNAQSPLEVGLNLIVVVDSMSCYFNLSVTLTLQQG